MRIGISVCSSYTMTDPREGAQFMVERARAARQADLDMLFVGDHHATPSHYFQNTPILGRMLAEWNANPAGALYLLPLWNPVLLAEQIGTLAAIMEGRFILQCALGGSRKQSAAMGINPKDRVPMFEDALSIMKALWAGETVSHDRFWPITNAKISPIPVDQVEVWVGAVATPAINRTARLADGWLGQPGIGLAEARKQANKYRQACAEHGSDPAAIAIRRDIFVGETSQEAKRVKERYMAKGYRGFDEDAFMTGSVAEIAEQMIAFEEAGFTDIVIRNISSKQKQALSTIELLAEVKKQIA